MANRDHSRWLQATDVHQSSVSQIEPIDLSKPDAEAVTLAEKLQALHTQITFVRVLNFTRKWVIRPIFWWPIKYCFKAIFWVLKNSNTKEQQYYYRTGPSGNSEKIYY